MILSSTLLTALQKRVTLLEDDLRRRCGADPQVNAPLQAQYEAARESKRTAETFNAWRDEQITQIAVAWVLACVFVRFLEDNQLLDTPFLAGPDAARMNRARDEQELFFSRHPTASERDYLLHVFDAVGQLPGMREFFDRRHNPLWLAGPTGDALAGLLDFWRKTNPDTGALAHDFTDPDWNTRFLGDLYQDLSEAARKRFALLQTPVFVEEFILDRTLTPAIETFGYKVVRLIDPTCGSGHFCLGGFHRLFRLWQQGNPGENPRVLAQRALDGVYGVDLNPYAVAIAKFRLLLAALQVSGINKLKNAPDFRLHLASGDSLLHGRRFRAHESFTAGPQMTFNTEEVFRDELKHHYEVEDAGALHRILGQQYHAVVGNPPYITVKDRAVSELYRARFPSCAGRYSLSVPFMERLFDLAVKGDGTPRQAAGFVGQITSNSFMKREFGKKLIEDYLPRWDLTHVVDSAGAYIPGHNRGGTPTVILFGKNQPPVSSNIRAVFGIRGEPGTPAEPALGLVWQAICSQIDQPGSESEWASVVDSPRIMFHAHPWSIGGGGAAELKVQLDEECELTLLGFVEIKRKKPNIGFASFMGLDDAFLSDSLTLRRVGIPEAFIRDYITGDVVRNWIAAPREAAFAPYDEKFRLMPLAPNEPWGRWLWRNRINLRNVSSFEETREAEGQSWWSWYRWIAEKYRQPLSITFASVATHNHFVFDRGGRVFNRHAPVIKLKPDTSEEVHVQLAGVLNSSAACFLLKQVCFPKDGQALEWHERFEFDGTKIGKVSIPAHQPSQLPTALVKTSTALQGQSPAATLASWGGPESGDLRSWLASARDLATRHRRQLIAWQEELDWQIYEAFGLVEGAAESGPAAVSLPEGAAVDAIPPEGLELGQRAFEIVLARRMAAGEAQSTWFERHGSTPITEAPRHWPAPYRELVERRLRRIAGDPAIRLIEQPEYKRRWNTEPWDEQQERALRQWLLNRLEGYFFEGDRVGRLEDGFSPAAHGFRAATQPALASTNQLAELVQADAAFLKVAEVYVGAAGFSVPKLVRELVESESVPFLPFQRYKESGLRKRQDWERTWELQREEDRIEAEIQRLKVEIDERLTELVQKERPAIVKAAAAAQEALDKAEVAFHEKFHPGKPYDAKHPYWAMESIPAEQLQDVLALKELAKTKLTAKHAVDVARGELARQDSKVTDLQQHLEALQKPAVPVPPKYAATDFKKSNWWKLRGKLDVPKERWVSYPGTEREGDPNPVIAWAGWNHLQQSQALAEYYITAKDTWGWMPDRLTLLLAGLADLLPWLQQWHNELNPEYGMGLGDYFAGFLDEECRKNWTTTEGVEGRRFAG
jgi:hypothetical protein